MIYIIKFNGSWKIKEGTVMFTIPGTGQEEMFDGSGHSYVVFLIAIYEKVYCVCLHTSYTWDQREFY